MAQPGMPGGNFPGEDYVIRRLKDLERTVQQLAAANQLATAGIKAVPGGIVVEGSQTVNGPLTINGDSEVNGALAINGPLTLQSGIIQNDALANPVQIGTASNGLNNYAITTASTVRATVTLTVPDGFTEAVVTATATAMGQNSTATTDYLYCMAVIQGISGGELYTAAGAGLGVGLASPFQHTLTGLTGGDVVTVSVATRAGFNTWAAATANQANIYATAYFLR
ncbi:hypothetical protein [Arthrobacter sp. B10-11]|uniref:hypothetical protein n=1 Tax=Arthrobacter sp. B10-11 TaxID=3081160 RepID=UPI002953C6A1|nr:hypothetical protein [Arthrobacter sp. B10-11]MDV8147248.1 hypothetical protein [Arthrobacter sp. B10-11]